MTLALDTSPTMGLVQSCIDAIEEKGSPPILLGFEFKYTVSTHVAASSHSFSIKDLATEGEALYGEILPESVESIMTNKELIADLKDIKVVTDFGMGSGKIPLQLFEQFPNLREIYGIELIGERYNLAANNTENLYKHLFDKVQPNQELVLSKNVGSLELHIQNKTTHASIKKMSLHHGSLFKFVEYVEQSDLIILDVLTDFKKMQDFLRCAKPGAIIVSYMNMHKHMKRRSEKLFREIKPKARMKTSWAVRGGHRFYYYSKI